MVEAEVVGRRGERRERERELVLEPERRERVLVLERLGRDWLEEEAVVRGAEARVVLAGEWGWLAADLILRVAVVCWGAWARWQERREAGQVVTGNEGGGMLRAERRQDLGKMSEERARETKTERLRLRRLS